MLLSYKRYQGKRLQHCWKNPGYSKIGTQDANASAFGNQKSISITLVSKLWVATSGILLGAIRRVSLPSNFGRDALCCDLVFNSSSQRSSGRSSLRVRLINVHLDSLPINPSLRPHQIFIGASYLSAAGRGIIAGDSILFSSKTTTLSAPTILLMHRYISIQMTQVTLGV
jgi:hypothetical protein